MLLVIFNENKYIYIYIEDIRRCEFLFQSSVSFTLLYVVRDKTYLLLQSKYSFRRSIVIYNC